LIIRGIKHYFYKKEFNNMGCKCKEKYADVAKYSDEKEPFKKFNFLETIFMFLGRIVMAILMAALIIIILPLFLIYILVCYLFGKNVILNLNKLIRYMSKHKVKDNKKKEILTD
jgi:uncharacterized protein YqhQ